MPVNNVEGFTEEEKQDLVSGAYWKPVQLAEALSFSTIYIQILCAKGVIRAIRYNHRWRIPKTEIDRILKEGVKPLPKPLQSIPVEKLILDEKAKNLIKPEINKPWWQKEIRIW